jgi:hypothetical protein
VAPVRLQDCGVSSSVIVHSSVGCVHRVSS